MSVGNVSSYFIGISLVNVELPLQQQPYSMLCQ